MLIGYLAPQSPEAMTINVTFYIVFFNNIWPNYSDFPQGALDILDWGFLVVLSNCRVFLNGAFSLFTVTWTYGCEARQENIVSSRYVRANETRRWYLIFDDMNMYAQNRRVVSWFPAIRNSRIQRFFPSLNHHESLPNLGDWDFDRGERMAPWGRSNHRIGWPWSEDYWQSAISSSNLEAFWEAWDDVLVFFFSGTQKLEFQMEYLWL